MPTIYCFSSTGNSLRVANRIAEGIGAEVLSMAHCDGICNDDVIGFVFPAYFWGLPKTVTEFISRLQITNVGVYIFTVVTYGGFIMGVPGRVKSLLRRKGHVLSYGNTQKCVENYLPGYRTNYSPEFQEKIEAEINIIANEIANKKLKKVGSYTALNKLIYRFYPAHKKDCDKYFTVDDLCQKCGMCQKICPRGNIELNSDKLLFRHDCELCIACLHVCPAQAINWKDKTRGKKRYMNPHITTEELTFFNRGKRSEIS